MTPEALSPRGRRRTDRLLVITTRGLGAGAVLLCILAFTPVLNRLAELMGEKPRIEPAQAIVVLGSGLSADLTLSAAGLSRLAHAIVLWRQGLSPVIVFSGAGFLGGPSEAEVAARYAVALGVPADAILAEGGGRTTREESVRIAALLHPRGIRRVLLVSSDLHLARGVPLFARAGFEPLPAPSDRFSGLASSAEDRLYLGRALAQELLAQLYYRLAGYI